RSWQALAHTLITLLPPLTVADLGAGEGTLSQLLAKRARKVIAIDNSPKMVEFGSQLAKKHGFKNLEYRLGDIEDPPIAKESVDLAILSQALHHAIHPERAIGAAHRILKRGGRLVILDLLSHRFEKARELYADHWLGFSEVQLHQFLEKSGFRDIEVSVVSREKQSPHFQTVFAGGVKWTPGLTRLSITQTLGFMVSTEKSVALPGFFGEVRRRKVYRVAAAYIIAAGGIIQLASAAFPAWELPSWTFRVLIVCLLMGFPVALMLAWAFDITADGIQATPDVAAPRTHRRRNVFMLVATGVIMSASAGFFLLPRVSAHKCDKSIAVLPFENLSDEKGNAYFADGIQDDVLTNLSKVGDLKVISRTSVMPYRGKPSNAREIGKTLGVGAILEGSVRRI